MLSRNGIVVENIAEEIVERSVDRHMRQEGACTCDRCRMDVIALTLNALPPKYIATAAGDVYARFQIYSDQYQVEIVAAIIRAIQRVREHPRHGEAGGAG